MSLTLHLAAPPSCSWMSDKQLSEAEKLVLQRALQIVNSLLCATSSVAVRSGAGGEGAAAADSGSQQAPPGEASIGGGRTAAAPSARGRPPPPGSAAERPGTSLGF